MTSANPTQIVRKNVAVLVFESGQVFRGANFSCAISKANSRQAADVLAGFERNAGKGNGKLRRNVLVGIQIVAMRAQVIEAEAKFVDQIIAKRMDFTGGQPFGGVVAVAILKAAAIEYIAEW